MKPPGVDPRVCRARKDASLGKALSHSRWRLRLPGLRRLRLGRLAAVLVVRSYRRPSFNSLVRNQRTNAVQVPADFRFVALLLLDDSKWTSSARALGERPGSMSSYTRLPKLESIGDVDGVSSCSSALLWLVLLRVKDGRASALVELRAL
jgi:hypothetical protein